MVDAGGLDELELFVERGDGGRAVRGVEHAARMRLERDERGLAARLSRAGDGVPDDVEVAEVHAVVAADREGDRPYVIGRKPEMCLQLRTFSGTKVRRNGSVWPSATRRPWESCARTRPGAGSGSTRTGRPRSEE